MAAMAVMQVITKRTPTSKAVLRRGLIGTRWERMLAGERAVGALGPAGSRLSDRDQREAGVADLLEQAVQCCLVDDGTLDEGAAAVFAGQGHRLDVGGPAGCEAALDPNAVPPGVGCSVNRGGCSSVLLGWCGACTLGADLVIRRHHTW